MPRSTTSRPSRSSPESAAIHEEFAGLYRDWAGQRRRATSGAALRAERLGQLTQRRQVRQDDQEARGSELLHDAMDQDLVARRDLLGQGAAERRPGRPRRPLRPGRRGPGGAGAERPGDQASSRGPGQGEGPGRPPALDPGAAGRAGRRRRRRRAAALAEARAHCRRRAPSSTRSTGSPGSGSRPWRSDPRPTGSRLAEPVGAAPRAGQGAGQARGAATGAGRAAAVAARADPEVA